MGTTAISRKAAQEGYQSIIDRMEAFFPHAECVRFSVCYKLVKNEFRSFTRKSELDEDGQPRRYFIHIQRGLLMLLDRVGCKDMRTLLTYLFHDTREDTRMSLEEITFVAGADVSMGVALVSKVPKQAFLPRLLLHGTWREFLVKVVDRVDNLLTMGTDKAFREKTLKETQEIYLPLANQMVHSTEPGTPERVWCERARAILLETLKTVEAEVV